MRAWPREQMESGIARRGFFLRNKDFIGILMIALLAVFPACSDSGRVGDVKDVCFKGQCIRAEIARTPEERSRGLQARTSLGRQEGMLFIFEENRRHSFWMKETMVPLDMIWMDPAKRIVFILPQVSPCQEDPCPAYTPDEDAAYVLEVNAGVAAELGLRVGDMAEF